MDFNVARHSSLIISVKRENFAEAERVQAVPHEPPSESSPVVAPVKEKMFLHINATAI